MASSRSRNRGAASQSEAYTRLRSMLLGGEVQPGQRLSHRSLAKDLGLSRSPVREALLTLEAEGIIEHRPQSGVYLRDVSPEEMADLYDIRELIEPYAAGLAAGLANTTHLAQLEKACAELTAFVEQPKFARWLDAPENRRRLSHLDREFHTTILAAAGNRVARRFFENAQVLSIVVSWNFLGADSATLATRTTLAARHHRVIYEAIRNRDPAKAARLMRAHIAGMKARVLSPKRLP